ncbi:MAG: biotin synthase BioB [Verrucomicrobiota bacterium]
MDWKQISERVLAGEQIAPDEALCCLRSRDDELLAMLDAAFRVRRCYYGRGVRLHVIRNARSGSCSEDCAYCSQSVRADGKAPQYPWQSREEIVAGAREARRMGAFRYCVVSSGRAPSDADILHICETVRVLKAEVPIQVCVSLGMLTPARARQLKGAGVNRYNHNLETSEQFFPNICATHTYADRIATVTAVKAAGLELCCGGLLGLGETLEDRVALAMAVREVQADSIPVNFLDPRPGTPFGCYPRMTPAECLRALAMFRFVNPSKEIRVAGGREACLGPMQVLALFAANSMFTNGYLTTGGQGYAADLTMLKAAGFTIEEITHS